VLLAISVIALAITGGAAAQNDEGGINLEVDDSLVEVTVASGAFARRASDVVKEVRVRASDLPDELMSRVHEATSSSGNGRRSTSSTTSRTGNRRRSTKAKAAR
jgi:hypothetical protein